KPQTLIFSGNVSPSFSSRTHEATTLSQSRQSLKLKLKLNLSHLSHCHSRTQALSSPVFLTASGLALKLVIALCQVTVSQSAHAFPALVVAGGRSSRSWGWSSSSLFDSSPSRTQSHAFPAFVAHPGAGRRCGLLASNLAVSSWSPTW
ncbi:uncharacterized protein LOC127745519, partial [Arachis duranensis]|uniref:Uncharacterized protein LOC127745519 n=1 Tax=Arachis duranensis TaxID=130453 RepID=A0A9C6TCX9_ARADU